MLTEVICGVLGRHNMVARNCNISIQNCKTENYSQASLCCRPKLVSDLVQASNGYNFGRDSKDASTSDFFLLLFFWCGFCSFFFSTFSILFFSFFNNLNCCKKNKCYNNHQFCSEHYDLSITDVFLNSLILLI